MILLVNDTSQGEESIYVKMDKTHVATSKKKEKRNQKSKRDLFSFIVNFVSRIF